MEINKIDKNKIIEVLKNNNIKFYNIQYYYPIIKVFQNNKKYYFNFERKTYVLKSIDLYDKKDNFIKETTLFKFLKIYRGEE